MQYEAGTFRVGSGSTFGSGRYGKFPRGPWAGFVGAQSEVDPSRADASPWNEQLPVVAAFRKALGIAR
jgi:hypothetical protein